MTDQEIETSAKEIMRVRDIGGAFFIGLAIGVALGRILSSLP